MSSAGATDSAPISHQANVVDLVICVASGVGALIIIAPYIASKHSRKLRHSLILGLATSDLISNTTVIASTAYLVHGDTFSADSPACTFLGYALSSGLYAQHMWNLAILAVTYMILVHPLSRITLTFEGRVIWLYPIIWGIALSLNAIPWVLAGFSYSNGYCYIGKKAGSAFPSVFQLVPRCIVVSIILILYTRLFFFLRRTDLFKKTGGRGSAEESDDASISTGDPEVALKDQTDGGKESPSEADEEMRGRSYLPSVCNDTFAASAGEKSGTTSANWRSDCRSISKSDYTPPVELQDYGFLNSPTATPRTATSGRELPSSPITMPTTATITTPAGDPNDFSTNLPAALPDSDRPMEEKVPAAEAGSSRVNLESPSSLSPFPASSAGDEASNRESVASVAGNALGASHAASSSSVPQQKVDGPASGGLEVSDEEDVDEDIPDYHSWIGLTSVQPMCRQKDFNVISVPRKGVQRAAGQPRYSSQTASVIEVLRSGPPSSKAAAVLDIQDKANSGSGVIPCGSSGLVIDHTEGRHTEVKQPVYDADVVNSFTWGQNVTSAAAPKNGGRRRGANVDAMGNKLEGEEVQSRVSNPNDNGVENIGSTLNRQASAMLLLYPLAYTILFSVSVIRLIRDLVNPGLANKVNDPLHTISRWFVFAQGALDCIIFKVIEHQFRRRMKRKRALARGEEMAKSDPQAFGLRLKTVLTRVWERHVQAKPESDKRTRV